MANRIANGMAIAIKGCHVREMAHSTPLHYLWLRLSCGVSGCDQSQRNGDLGSLAARLDLEIER